MCDLLGISCNEMERASRSLPEFALRYSEKNRHGWGIAYFDGAHAVIKRDTGKAHGNKKFEETWKKVSNQIHNNGQKLYFDVFGFKSLTKY